MKKILLIISLLLIVGILIISYILINKGVTSKTATINNNITMEEFGIVSIPKNINENQIVQNYTCNPSYLIDISNNEVLVDNSDFIIIGRVQSIDGVTNYNPTTKTYIDFPCTVGKIKVEKVLKGNLEEKNIPFIKIGGTISIQEYEKSLSKEEKEEMGFNKLTKEEKANLYVSKTMEEDVSIEENKTYLMYLCYDENYQRYSIGFVQYGLREIDAESLNSDPNLSNSDTETLTSNEYKTVKVKDNTNGSYDTLDFVIPDKIKKNK